VFRDLDTIAAGEDFVEALRRKIAQSDVVLVLIGPRWLGAADDAGHWRLADEKDWVRTEIEIALERNIRVIPVLLQAATMPRAKDLPRALAGLAVRNAVDIRDASFDQDVGALIDKLGATWRHKLGRVLMRPSVYAAVAVVLVAVIGVAVYPYVALTPERARIRIVQMGLSYDERSFVSSAARNDVQAVRLFLAAGMKPDSADERGSSALKAAAADLHLETVKLLFERGARDDGALAVAVAAPDKREVFDFLLAHQPSSGALGAALRSAAGTPYTDLVQRLLDRGADANAKSARRETALHVAASALELEQVRLLLAKGADVNAADHQGETALHEAINARRAGGSADEQRRIEILDALVRKGAAVNARARPMVTWQPTPLLLAIREGQPSVALWLLEHGADPSVWSVEPGDRHLNALMWATRTGLPDVVGALLAKGVAVDLRNDDESTALLEAFSGRGDSTACVQALIVAGADANVRDNEGHTALILAARSDAVEALRLLLASGATANATDKQGWSALMHAAHRGQVDAARELLAAGADPSIKNNQGDDARAVATQAGQTGFVRLLAGRVTAVPTVDRRLRKTTTESPNSRVR
jgi:ankyrin repeat protein